MAADDEHDEPRFWEVSPQLDTDEDNIDSLESFKQREESSRYNAKKPKWWIQKSGRGTKSQRRTMRAMEAYRLRRVQYNEEIQWDKVFDHQEIWLEIGFGQGENLLANACNNPNVGLVGAEIHKPGVGNALKRMQESIETGNYWSGYNKYTPDKDPCNQVPLEQDNDDTRRCLNAVTPPPTTKPYSNVRVHIGDGMNLLSYIPSGSISSLLVTFPDPFPQKSNQHYRLVQVSTLKEMHRVLCKTPLRGRFLLATDHEGYNEWCSSVFQKVNEEAEKALSNGECNATRFRQVNPCPDRCEWLPAISKYEQKGWDEGRHTMLQCWEVWPPEVPMNEP